MNLDLSRPPLALVVATQVLLGALSLVGLGAIALLPSVSASVADSLPEYANLRGPLLARDFNGELYCDLAFTSPGAHLSVVQVFGSATGSTWRAGTPPRWPPPVTLCTPKRWPW